MLAAQLNGFLLHKRAYRETSFLTDFFTLEHGKVSAVVKGVRGNKGDKKSLLQSFQPLLVQVSGKHELRNVNQLESSASMIRLVGHQLFSAMYINELLNRLLPKEVPHPELYALYSQCLLLLENGSPIEPCLRQFELNLLADLGYGIDLIQEFDTGLAVEAHLEYALVLEQGIQRVHKKVAGATTFSGEALLQMQDYYWTAASLQCAKRINRMALSHVLGHKPLKSRELFQQARPTSQSN